MCPKASIGAETWEAIELAELYRKGLPPVAGGSMDQAAGFVTACRQIWADRAAMTASMDE
jgi:hypothetical protein